jgi:hypothetical protein
MSVHLWVALAALIHVLLCFAMVSRYLYACRDLFYSLLWPCGRPTTPPPPLSLSEGTNNFDFVNF